MLNFVKNTPIAVTQSVIRIILVLGLVVAASTSQAEAQRIVGFDPLEFPEEHCLALNIYYEARSSNLADKAAVADVVLNRMNDTRYPNTVCGVVQDGYVKGRRDCQFSWYCDGKSDIPADFDRWSEAQNIAFAITKWSEFRGISEGATHYHADYVQPYWASSLQLVGTIGRHVFYRWNK